MAANWTTFWLPFGGGLRIKLAELNTAGGQITDLATRLEALKIISSLLEYHNEGLRYKIDGDLKRCNNLLKLDGPPAI